MKEIPTADDLKLKEYVRGADRELHGPTGMVTEVSVKVVVSGDEASVMLGATSTEGKYSCVKYRGIPLDDEFSFDSLGGAEGLTDKGFMVEAEKDNGWRGNAVSIEWAETNRKGKDYGADILRLQVGNGMYGNAAGESLYAGNFLPFIFTGGSVDQTDRVFKPRMVGKGEAQQEWWSRQ